MTSMYFVLTHCKTYSWHCSVRNSYLSSLLVFHLTLPYHTGKTFYCLALNPLASP